MAMTEAHKRYREKNPAHKKGDDEKRLDLIISAGAMAAITLKCKAAGITRRQLLEAMALTEFDYHTGVMLMPEITPGLQDESATGVSITPVSPEGAADGNITPVLPDEPETDSGIESRILLMIKGGFTKGESSPIPKQVVELYDGDYPEAAKRVRRLAAQHKGTVAGENLQTLANRIDGSRPKKTKPQEI